jgi:hypothetical protein
MCCCLQPVPYRNRRLTILSETPTKELERNFSLWADELRAIAEIGDAQSQKEKLNAFVADRFQTNMTAKAGELADDMKRYTLFTIQQYRTRYLLARLTQYVDMAYKGLKTPGSLNDYTVLPLRCW